MTRLENSVGAYALLQSVMVLGETVRPVNIWERNGNMVTLMKQVKNVFLLSLNGLGIFTMAAPRICSMTENFGYISGMDILMFQETLSFLQIFPERTISRTDMLLSHGLTRI